jgi:hypothetical protein
MPGTKTRRQELEANLREARASISDEMGVISTNIDLTPHIHQRRVLGDLASGGGGEGADRDYCRGHAQCRAAVAGLFLATRTRLLAAGRLDRPT